MRRIRFASGGVPVTRILTESDQFREALFALEMLGRDAGGWTFRRWRKRVARHRAVRDLVTMARTVRPFPDMDQIVQRACSPLGGDADGCGPEPQLVADVREFHRIAVAPYRDHIDRFLEADRATRRDIALTHGPEGLLSTLHPSIRWSFPVLEVPTPHDEDLELDTRGLLLSPSLFLTSRSPRVLGPSPDDGIPTLFYPVTPERGWRMPARTP